MKFLLFIGAIYAQKDSIFDIEMEIQPDSAKLLQLAHYKMPFGKYRGSYLIELPIAYLVWFKQKGFPKGVLGEHLCTTLDIKSNGLEPIIRKLQKEFPIE